MGIDAAGSGEFSASVALHADPTVQSAIRAEYPNRVFELARFGINWLAPMPLGSDRQPDTVRFKVQHADLGSRKRTAVLDEDAALHGPEDRSEFSRRTATWSRLAAAGLEFYR
jgi:hypothetical protein